MSHILIPTAFQVVGVFYRYFYIYYLTFLYTLTSTSVWLHLVIKVTRAGLTGIVVFWKRKYKKKNLTTPEGLCISNYIFKKTLQISHMEIP